MLEALIAKFRIEEVCAGEEGTVDDPAERRCGGLDKVGETSRYRYGSYANVFALRCICDASVSFFSSNLPFPY
jgi:hypothetical protein